MKDNQHSVVFQLSNNDPFVQKALILQLNSLLDEMADVRIEVVVHGFGVDLLLTGSPFSEKIEALRMRGVAFLVCGNTLRSEKLDPANLLSAGLVPGGIAHIIRRQREGWSYIKSGY